MKVTRDNGDNQQIVLTIEVEVEAWNKAVDQAVKRIAGQVNIPGFRRGKAPRRIVENTVGIEAILDEAYDNVAQKAFNDALDAEKLELATYPHIERVTVEAGKPMVFKATVTKKPEVTLGEYKGLKVEKVVEAVTDEAVTAHIDKMRERQAKMVEVPADAAVANDDFVTLDFKGFVDGEAFPGGEGKDYPLQIGSGSFIPGFEEQLVGAKVDEERDVNVTFPEDYHEKSLAGKAAVFKCKIHGIKRKEVPELTDDLVEKISVFHTVDELTKDVREKMEDAAEKKATNEQRVAAIDKAADNATIDVPNVMVEDRISQMIEELAMRMEQQGMKFEQYLQYSGNDMTKLRESYREQALKNVRTDLMLEAVAKAEDIKVTNEDIETEILMMANMYGANPAQVKKIIKQQGRVGDIAITVMRRKTAKFIIDAIAE